MGSIILNGVYNFSLDILKFTHTVQNHRILKIKTL